MKYVIIINCNIKTKPYTCQYDHDMRTYGGPKAPHVHVTALMMSLIHWGIPVSIYAYSVTMNVTYLADRNLYHIIIIVLSFFHLLIVLIF